MSQPNEATAEQAAERAARRPFDFNAYLPYHLSYPVGTISRVLAGAMQERFGLKSAHWRIMSLLGSRGPVSTRDLSNFLSTEKSAISRATTELIQRGYVLRVVHPVDRRLLMLHFSPRGKRLFDQMIAVAREFEAELMKEVTAEELAVLVPALNRLRDAALRFQAAFEAGKPKRKAARRAKDEG